MSRSNNSKIMVRTLKPNGNGGTMYRLRIWGIKFRINSFNRKLGEVFYGEWVRHDKGFYTKNEAQAVVEELENNPPPSMPQFFDLGVEEEREYKIYRLRISASIRERLGILYWDE